MQNELIIRAGQPEDYPSFKAMEEKAWEGSGIEVISEEMFLTWLDVFPEGLRLAEHDGQICGHLYGQICNFNPLDAGDCRDLDTMTDCMYTAKTHDPDGNCVYTFSVSATRDVVRPLNYYYINMVRELSKQFYAGVVRMSDLDRYAMKQGIESLAHSDVVEYARLVNETMKGKRKGQPKVFDRVVSPILKIANGQMARVIENFFPFSGSQSWGCLLYWENEK